jgi:hypothetical protein
MCGFIVVKQYLLGQWVELIKLEVPEEEKHKIDESLSKMRDLIFDHDKVSVYDDKSVVIFNRLDGPVKLDYIVEVEPPEEGIA